MLVLDTSVLVDVERGSFLKASFCLPFRFVVPDLLYERELKNHGGEELQRLGLIVEELDDKGLTLALDFHRRVAALTLADSFALALAKTCGGVLLTGDGALRGLAEREGVECHGVLWLLDEIHKANTATVQELHAGLTAISNHPRCRLPRPEVRRRLTSYAVP